MQHSRQCLRTSIGAWGSSGIVKDHKIHNRGISREYRYHHTPSKKRRLLVKMRHSFSKTTFDLSNFKTYHAQCYCGVVRFEADVSPPSESDHEVVTCNCKDAQCLHTSPPVLTVQGSLCFRTGTYNVYLPAERVRFTVGEEKLNVSRMTSERQYATLIQGSSPTGICRCCESSVQSAASRWP